MIDKIKLANMDHPDNIRDKYKDAFKIEIIRIAYDKDFSELRRT